MKHEESISAVLQKDITLFTSCYERVLPFSPCGWQTALSEYRSIFYPTKYYLKLMDLPSIYPSYASKIPENLMLLHGVVIFLGFFAIKTFLTEWLCLGHFPSGWQIAFNDFSSIFYQDKIRELISSCFILFYLVLSYLILFLSNKYF